MKAPEVEPPREQSNPPTEKNIIILRPHIVSTIQALSDGETIVSIAISNRTKTQKIQDQVTIAKRKLGRARSCQMIATAVNAGLVTTETSEHEELFPHEKCIMTMITEGETITLPLKVYLSQKLFATTRTIGRDLHLIREKLGAKTTEQATAIYASEQKREKGKDQGKKKINTVIYIPNTLHYNLNEQDLRLLTLFAEGNTRKEVQQKTNIRNPQLSEILYYIQTHLLTPERTLALIRGLRDGGTISLPFPQDPRKKVEMNEEERTILRQIPELSIPIVEPRPPYIIFDPYPQHDKLQQIEKDYADSYFLRKP